MADLLGAMAMEKEYRKLQTAGTEAKEAFGYHDKLKQFGFADTVEYEFAKKKYHIKNAGLVPELTSVSNALAMAKKAVINQTSCLYFAYPPKISVWHGVNDPDGIDMEYCENNDIQIFEVERSGGSVVATTDDLAAVAVLPRTDLADAWLKLIQLGYSQVVDNCTIDGNDILIDGYKVSSISADTYNNMGVYFFQFSIVVDLDLINNVCLKPMKKIPKGLSEYGISRINVMRKFESWLQ
jgi:hypothetical protein